MFSVCSHSLTFKLCVTKCICTLCLCSGIYSVVSLCRCSFVFVRHSIFYLCVTCCDLDVTISLSETTREKARGNNNDLSYVPSKRKEEIKSGTSGCGSVVVPYFQPLTSTTNHLHISIYRLIDIITCQILPESHDELGMSGRCVDVHILIASCR